MLSLGTTFDRELNPLPIGYALQLSSNLPLKLCLDLQSGFGDASEDEDAGVPLQWDIVRKLISQIPRTSHLAVRLFWYHAEAFISELMQEAPLLVHMEIDGEYGYNSVILWTPTSPLSTYGLELLNNLKINGKHVREDIQLEMKCPAL
ncbi:hypothetical protein PC9H_000081 [Pleurotus ostreatus]|uniref:Uncharacterized protein n=1 Tax=Pleurotus ostreatus TaxID=5322 RepID=A0A8H7DWF6_PLEOS|nr:uncharacterized protein PC9H_000081 [Pleurotus ostreatus]KAF7439745.1 hypothetical protein PC9H_000081 [Pleurotus ostreatus]